MGTISKLTGGKFANGAGAAAFASILSEAAANSQTKSKAPSAKLQKLFASDKVADRQLAIDEAIKHYEINMKGVKSVTYDPLLTDHGITYQNGVVEIGPSNFNHSPGWLGSTLAHEIEVHFKMQAQAGNWWTDVQGMAIQKVQAYNYEIANASRFSLTASEVSSLQTARQNYFNQLNSANRARATAGDFYTYTH